MAAGKLTEGDKTYILDNYNSKMQKTLASELGCSIDTIRRFLDKCNIDEKKCRICNGIKPTGEFREKRRICKSCEYIRDHKDGKKQKTETIRNRLNKEKAVNLFGNKCDLCNNSFPSVCYDFHHTEDDTKKGNPSYFLKSNWDKAKQELEKCIMVCKNCHAIIHFGGNKQ